MLQAPTVTSSTPVPTAVLIGVLGSVAGWLARSALAAGFQRAVVNSIKTELDNRLKEMEKRFDQKLRLFRDEIQLERRGLPPRRGPGGGHYDDSDEYHTQRNDPE